MSRKLVSLGILGMVSFSLITGLILFLNAASILDTAAPQADDPISAAELEDLQFIASQKGISLQTAIERYAWHDDLAAEVSRIREAFPADFTGAKIVDAGNAWVAFAGATPAGASDIIDAWDASHSGVSVEKRTNLGFNELEKQKAIEAVHHAVYESPEVLEAVTRFDFTTSQVRATVILQDTASDSVLGGLVSSARSNLTDKVGAGILDHITVSVILSNAQALGGVESSSKHMGGETLFRGDEEGCTTGFVVVDSGGNRGIATAGHCENDHAFTDDDVTLTFQAPHYVGAYGDFEWHTGSQDMPSDFYAGDSSSSESHIRHVSYGGVGSPMMGQTLCRNGRVTYKNCASVYDVDRCGLLTPWGHPCKLVEMDDYQSADGDSGGPVYMADTAYGLHQGWVWENQTQGFKHEVFSRAEYFDDAFPGVDIAVD